MEANSGQANEAVTRQALRVPIAATVQFRSGMRRFQASVSDLSTHGARISSPHLLRAGDRFFLKLAMLEALEAEIVWADRFEAGCRFVRPIHPAAFEAVVGAR